MLAAFVAVGIGALAWAAILTTFTRLTDGPATRTGVSFTVSDQSPEKAYAFGGLALFSTANNLYVYDSTGNTWTEAADTTPPSARAWHGSAWDSTGQRLVIFGGSTGTNGTVIGDLHAYNPATLAWTPLTQTGDVPTARWGPLLKYVPHLNRFFLFSGATGMKSGTKVSAVDDTMRWLTVNYTTNTATWTLIAPNGTVPEGRNTSCAGYDAVNHDLYMFWGEKVDASVNDGWRYDLDTNVWTALTPGAPVPAARISPICAWDPRTKLLLSYGGADNPTSNTMLSDAWSYDPALNQWAAITPTPGTRTTSGSDYSPTLKSMLFFGGRTGPLSVSKETYKLFANHAPTAGAGVDQLVPGNTAVVLSGTGSDADADAITYAWAQTAGTAVTLTGATTATAGFTSPAVAVDTPLTFQVTVNDGFTTTTDTVIITVQGSGNLAPTADAGVDFLANEVAAVSLSGSGTDPDLDPLTYAWTQTLGTTVTLTGPTTATPSFTSPTVTANTVLEFELTVNDGRGGTGTDRVRVTVQNNVNEPPTANAGVDANRNEQVSVSLSGSGTDPNADPLSYGWTQTLGPAVTLTGATTATPSFTSPAVTANTVLEFELTVNDGNGGTATDRVRITVQNNLNEPPTANAGVDANRNEQVSVSLSGSGTDPNADPLSYGWTQTLGPAVTLTGATTATPSFTSPAVTANTVLEFELTVNDGNGGTATDRVRITVQNNVNEVPTANAGVDANANESVSVSLSGSGTDPNGDPLTYGWTQTLGPAVTLTGTTTATPSFTSPSVTVNTVLEFELTVNDGQGGTATDRVRITVQNNLNEVPTANAGVDANANENVSVSLSGSGTDPNSDPLTYGWTQTLGPAVTLTGATTATPSFTSPTVTANTVLEFELTVNDGKGGTATDRVRITVQNNVNEVPTANAGVDANANEQAAVTLSGSGTDPNGDSLTYGWTQTLGTAVTLTGATTATPSFTTPTVAAITVLEFELTVNDGRGGTATDRVRISVQNNGNDPPTANAGADSSPNEQVPVSLSGSGTDPNADPLSYGWTQTLGPAVALTGAATATPSFTTPAVTAVTVLEFELTVSDGRGGTATDRVLVTVQNNLNDPPTANAGPDANVNEQATVSLSGSGTDPNADPLTFAWTQTLGPAVALTGPTTSTPSFTSPAVTLATTFEFELTVSDGRGGTATDTVLIRVGDSLNDSPSADAGVDLASFGGLPVSLDGSGSSDPNGDALSYVWAQTLGAPVTLTGATAAIATWVAPPSASAGLFEFQLTVNDGRGGSATDTVLVSVGANRAPVADAGMDLRLAEGSLVNLDGSGSSDPDGDALQFSWAQTAGPAMSLNGPATSLADFTSPAVVLDTTFEFELTVSDLHGVTATDRVQVVVTPTPNDPPVADAGVDLVLDEGVGATLDGRGSFDPEGGALVYAWTQVSGPSAPLTLADSAQPVLAPMRVLSDTSLEYELRVTDPRGAQATDRVVVLVRETLNDLPRADAGPDQQVDERVAVQLDGTGSMDPEGQALTFSWKQLDGPAVTLTGASTATPGFDAPGVSGPTELRFELQVTDPGGASATDEVLVTIHSEHRELSIGCGCGASGFELMGLLAAATLLRSRRAQRRSLK